MWKKRHAFNKHFKNIGLHATIKMHLGQMGSVFPCRPNPFNNLEIEVLSDLLARPAQVLN
jgi:hypothetical protein